MVPANTARPRVMAIATIVVSVVDKVDAVGMSTLAS